MARLEERIRLPDGRRLGYARFGQPAGRPLIYLHGFPASRFEAGVLDAAARRLDVALIAPDRPGFGLSSYQPGRTILDWPDDVLALADALCLDRFSLLGGSGGCPYAAACAYRLRQRLICVGTVAGLGPTTAAESVRRMGRTARLGFVLARHTPRLFALAYGGLARLVQRYPDLVFQLNEATPPDQEVLARHELQDILRRSVQEAFRQGTAGAVHEFKLLAGPWGFDLEKISVPFYIWHGLQDGVVPHAMAELLASKVPGAKLQLSAEDGHISLVVRHGAGIIETLV